MEQPLTTWGVATGLMVFALIIGWSPMLNWWREHRRQRLISGYGVSRLDNVVIEDGIGGSCVLEHVLLSPDGLMVLLPRQCEGALFGAGNIDQWTQMSGGRSYHFDNPLMQLEERVAALRCLLPGIPVDGRVLYMGRCEFPKGRPEGLLLLDELRQQAGRTGQAILPVIEGAWRTLQSQPRATADTAESYASSLPRILLAISLIVGAAVWVLLNVK